MKEQGYVWYGLKTNGRIVQVRYFDKYPSMSDFGVQRAAGRAYSIVVVRVREVCQIP